jgi:hypothetical protein
MPHQITAVYEAMLPRQPLRFLLADDPGAGKTIMAGLLMKELIARGAGSARGRPGTSRVLSGNWGRWLLVLLPNAPPLLPFKSRPYSAWRLSIAGPPLTREKMLEAASSH